MKQIDPSQPIEEWLSEFQGVVDAVLLVCTSMIATHPEKEKVLALLASLTKEATETPQDNQQTRRYKLGMRQVVSAIEQGVKMSQFGVERQKLGSH